MMTGLQSDDAMRGPVIFIIILAIFGTILALVLYFGLELPAREALPQVPLNTYGDVYIERTHASSFVVTRFAQDDDRLATIVTNMSHGLMAVILISCQRALISSALDGLFQAGAMQRPGVHAHTLSMRITAAVRANERINCDSFTRFAP